MSSSTTWAWDQFFDFVNTLNDAERRICLRRYFEYISSLNSNDRATHLQEYFRRALLLGNSGGRRRGGRRGRGRGRGRGRQQQQQP